MKSVFAAGARSKRKDNIRDECRKANLVRDILEKECH